jgi:serine/threonine protein kinase
MPITRERLNSTAKLTSNPKANTSNKNNFISSEDDLFERSACQSSSRQTRTINHVVPKEVSKKLANDFRAVSDKSVEMDLDKENLRNKDMVNGTKKIVSRPLVKRAVSKASHTSSHSPHFITGIQSTVSHSSSITKIPLSARKDFIDIEGDGVDDPIFDVPVTSPSPPRAVNLDFNDTKPMNDDKLNNIMNTPSKHSKLSISIGSLRSPSIGMAVPLVAEFRRTPLTMAEKKRRQMTLGALDKTTKTNISAFKNVKKEEEIIKEKDYTVENHKSEHLKESKNNVEKTDNINKEADNIEAGVEIDMVDIINIISSSPKKSKVKAGDHEEEEEEVKEVNNVNNEENSENINPSEKQTAKKKRKIFIRNQSTESAPPDIKVITRNISEVKAENTETFKMSKAEVVDGSSQDLSLVIKVPAPPKLEDLETLDPELYVKLKSGSLKDDPNIPFISETDRSDIENFLESFNSPELAKNLLPVAIIGEGTFSTVYKVIDKNFYECDNSAWTEYSRQSPLDWLRLWRWVYSQEPVEKFILYRDGKRCVDRNGKSLGGGVGVRTMTAASASTAKNSSKLAVLLRRYLMEWAMRSLDSLLPSEKPSEAVLASISPRALQSAMLRFRPYFIALKRINATSSPQRILDEMSFLKHLGGKNNVVPLINGFRCEDQVLVTFPYFYSEDFRVKLNVRVNFNYFLNFIFLKEFMGMQNFSINSIACYMRSLFISLAHLHAHNIIHRDVKPSNFLYAPEGGGRALLLDFGLAQKASNSNHSRGSQRHAHFQTSSTQQQLQLQQQRINTSRNNEKERKKLQAVNLILNSIGTSGKRGGGEVKNFYYNKFVLVGLEGGEPCEKLIQLTGQLGPGYFNNDPRAAMKASRAGTRGFRAPEVLFKCPNQTTSLDIWSAGVILLTLLTRRYPFFHSSDDYDAIVEIANIFGNEEMSGAAKLYSRKWTCNIPSVPAKHVTWPILCEKLNPTVVPEIPEECYDLLRECLNLNSEKRITAKNALKHSFIIKFAK